MVLQLFAVGIFLSSCGDRSPGTLDGMEPCPGGELRDGTGTCRALCNEEVPCHTGELCVHPLGMCIQEEEAACTEESCPAGFACPSTGAICVPVAGYCRTSFDCAVGQRCDGNQCVARDSDIVQTCVKDGDCGPLLTCEFGVCTGCVSDLQCGADGTCVFGTCFKTQSSPLPACVEEGCDEGFQCNLISGECDPVCQSSEDCEPEQTCLPIVNRCVDNVGCEGGCHQDMECIEEIGLCFGCESELQCNEGEICLLGVCSPFPQLPDLCADKVCNAESEQCDPLDGSCYAKDASCQSDQDCRPLMTCNLDGLCTGCFGDAHCRPGQICDGTNTCVLDTF